MVGHENGGFGDIQSTRGNLADWAWVVLARWTSWVGRHDVGTRRGRLAWVDVAGNVKADDEEEHTLLSSCRGSVGFI